MFMQPRNLKLPQIEIEQAAYEHVNNTASF